MEFYFFLKTILLLLSLVTGIASVIYLVYKHYKSSNRKHSKIH